VKKYIVRLSQQERQDLKQFITSGKRPAQLFTRARILLKADQGEEGHGWPDEKISQALDITVQTVERIRKQFVQEGFDSVLNRQEYTQKVSRRKIDGEAEAHLIAISCGKPPEGRSNWSLRLLAGRMVELGYVESISYETVRKTLKKTRSSPG
jgi:hypothetical protein